MFNQIIIFLLYGLVGCSLFFGLINLVRSNIYDLRQSKLRRQRKLHPQARLLRQRPPISVVVYANNDAPTILGCLTGLASSSYKKIQIVVVANACSDDTQRLVRQFAKKHPKYQIRLVAKRVAASRSEAISQAAKYVKGKMVLVVDANCVMDKQSLKLSVLHMLQANKSIVLFNIRAGHEYSLLGLADNLKSVLASRVKKAGGLITPGLNANNHAAIYTSETFKSILSSKRTSLDNINSLRRLNLDIGYESLALAKVSSSKLHAHGIDIASNQKMLATIQMIRNSFSIIEPPLIVFMLYVAIRFNNPGYVLVAWLTFTSLLILAIWSDETYGLVDKLRLSLLSLVAYSLYLLRQMADYLSLLLWPLSKLGR